MKRYFPSALYLLLEHRRPHFIEGAGATLFYFNSRLLNVAFSVRIDAGNNIRGISRILIVIWERICIRIEKQSLFCKANFVIKSGLSGLTLL